MALKASSPIPGIVKIDSKITEPPTAAGKTAAKMVMMGSKEFLKACFQTMAFSVNPFARALRM